MFKGEPQKAVRELQKSIELNPSYAHAHFALGATLSMGCGEPAASIPHLEMARRLSPRDYLLGAMMARQAEACVFLEQYDDGATLGKQAISEDSSWINNYFGCVSALGYLGYLEEARETISEMREIDKDVSVGSFRRRFLHANAPERDHLMEGLRKAGLPE